MNLVSITFKNLMHRKSRAFLTVLGVGVSIAAFVSLVGLASNLEDTLKVTYKTRGTDIVVVEKAAADILTSTIDASYLEKIKQLPEVKDVSAIMLDFSILGLKKYTLVYGWETHSYLFDELKISGNRPVESNETILGILAAKRLNKKIGDEIIIKGFKFNVVGIFQSKSIFEEGSIIISLNKLQELKKIPGKVTLLNIKINKQLSGKENYPDIEKRIRLVQNKIQSLFNDVEVKDIEDFVSTNTPIFTILNFTWAISVVALIIAILGITNTMMTSVLERTSEIGILIAIGWRNSRIFMLIMLESIFLSFLGGLIGVGLGYILTRILVYSPYFQGIQIHYDISLMAKAALSSIFLGFLAGIYPALKAVSISPIEVLRYEH